MRITNEYFLGIFFILIGVIFLLKYFTNINIPIFRTIVALIFIYVGVIIFIGGFQIKEENLVLFRTENIEVTDKQPSKLEYNIIFSKGNIDLTNVTINEEIVEVEINTVFSDGLIKINPQIPMKMEISSAFAGVNIPDNTNLNLGDYTYKTPGFSEDEPYVKVKSSSVFSSLSIIEEVVKE
ncbi:hypothetical protein SYNTR_1111 [Candidatus Syntrophocurvum alkaliphilum]|uniref:Cell wall-active antibiotics response LiaF-like C-terminal domain-containing protein n=1 Tax=Candidatus Syntrophocurvum alkaliphilum TaxID=2293317 RepID=A0A6I6DIK2_9FIRM|nr:hypothetical protein [Candidatus Syntrophocurvum alkaliphilum]QGT99704.1 hypothetical protein SYNTR_1111 [Candidatus Syntrophocurvum alkaliphilum]